MIKGLHHNAYRCRDPEETRKFYALEDLWDTAQRVTLPWEQSSAGTA